MQIIFTKSKIFLYFCLSFAMGVFIASFFKVPALALFAVAIIAVILISIFWRNNPSRLLNVASKKQEIKMFNRHGGKKIVIAGFCLIFAILGVCRYQMAKNDFKISDYSDYLDKNIVFQGVIAEEPNVRIKDVQYVVEVKSLKSKVESLGVSQSETTFNDFGKILITLPRYPAYKYGDLVEFDGKLKIPEKFSFFDYQEYLAKDDIYWTMYSPKTSFISSCNGNSIYSVIFSFKNVFKEKVARLLPEPEISLLNGLLLGERSGMGEKLKNSFSITGTSHIVAVSGFNVTIIAIIILEFCLFVGFSRNQAFWVSLFAIISFIIMVGAPASAIRAGIMGGLVLVAVRAGRLNSMANAIIFAAVLMLAINPKILRFDAGFQLSFLAVVGIVWVYPILDYYFRKLPDYLKIKSIFLVTISAQIMALPILIYNFDRLSLVAPLANILILPFIPIAMALGFLAGLFSFIWIAPAKIIGYFTWLVLAYQIRTIEFLVSFSWASMEIFNFGLELFVVYYIIVAIVIINFWKKKKNG